jgi:N-acylneuraminate cytidylyltransferase
MSRLLVVIPARGGSKGLPGKNLRPFAGLPLIAHSIRFAALCPEITRCIVSTDSEEIAAVARRFGAEVPFLRSAELARDATPVWEVVRDALARAEQTDGVYDLVALLDPTSPARLPTDVAGARRRLSARPDAAGVIAVSRPEFNPIWHCVVERDGWMADLIDAGRSYDTRQAVPAVYRINGALYLWRAGFARSHAESWRKGGRYILHEIPELRAMSIDTLEEFEKAEALVKQGLISLPWLEAATSTCAASGS